MPEHIYKSKKSPYWQYEFVLDGIRFHGSTRTKNKAVAFKVVQDKRNAVIAGEPVAARKMTLKEATGRYWVEHGQHQKSAQSFVWPRLCAIIDGLGGDTLLPDIGTNALATFVAKRRADVSPRTVNADLDVLRAVMRRARDVWEVKLGREPNWKAVKLAEPAQRKRYLSPEEETLLLGKLPGDLAVMARFSILTGVRLSSAYGLRWEHVQQSDDRVVFVNAKSARKGEVHDLPMTPALRLLLGGLRGQHATHVFTYLCSHASRPGAKPVRQVGERYPYTKWNWRKAWYKALRDLGLQNLRWHDLRHTAASRLVKKTGNIAMAQRMLGHASIRTTQRYAHVAVDDLRAGMHAMSRTGPGSESPRGGTRGLSVVKTTPYCMEHQDEEPACKAGALPAELRPHTARNMAEPRRACKVSRRTSPPAAPAPRGRGG